MISVLLISALSFKLMSSYFGIESLKQELEKKYINLKSLNNEEYYIAKDSLVSKTLKSVDDRDISTYNDNCELMLKTNEYDKLFLIFEYARNNCFPLFFSFVNQEKFICKAIQNREIYTLVYKTFCDMLAKGEYINAKQIFNVHLKIESKKIVLNELEYQNIWEGRNIYKAPKESAYNIWYPYEWLNLKELISSSIFLDVLSIHNNFLEDSLKQISSINFNKLYKDELQRSIVNVTDVLNLLSTYMDYVSNEGEEYDFRKMHDFFFNYSKLISLIEKNDNDINQFLLNSFKHEFENQNEFINELLEKRPNLPRIILFGIRKEDSVFASTIHDFFKSKKPIE
ncbi:MAG: hypothetical protein K5892_03280 [Acholeplasmatales bacterium]|nr:hypothetical protein [Acholeplasmatales bacterium]